MKRYIHALLISMLYVLLMEKVADVQFGNLPTCQRGSHKFVMLFVSGIVGIVVARKYLDRWGYNNTVKHGITVGGAVLAAKITVAHWAQMNEQLKLFVIAFGFTSIIVYAREPTEKRNKPKRVEVEDKPPEVVLTPA